MIDELELVKRTRPDVSSPGEQARARARGALEESIAGGTRQRDGRGRRFSLGGGSLVLALSVVVVAAVVGVFLGLRSHRVTTSGSGREPLQLVFRAAPAAGAPQVTPSAMQQTAVLIRTRLASVIPPAQVSLDHDELIIRVPRGPRVSVAEVKSLVERSDELSFFDWEANVLAPSGKPVSSLLRQGDPTALRISQGYSQGAGAPGAGTLSLFGAVKLASRQSAYVSSGSSRRGPEYFIFGKPGSAACDTPAQAAELKTGIPCYLAGPAGTKSQLNKMLPNGIAPPGARILKVNQGWSVVEAAYPAYHWPPLSDPSAQFFAVRDQIALSGREITDPHRSTDQTGQPDVSFGFTPKGAREFQSVTAAVAKRGQLVSGFGRTLYQHFAVALGSRLVTIPFIDFKQDPFGIPGNSGADIQGGFTIGTARRLAANIAPLPVRLKLVSTR